MHLSLAEQIRSYLKDPQVGLRPDDQDAEVEANTWTYDVAGSGPDRAPEVLTAFRDVEAGLRTRLQGSQPRGTFYVWYDDQAGQLRCSLTSLESPPFGAPLRTVADPSEIVHAALRDPSPGLLGWPAAVDVSTGQSGFKTSHSLTVWVVPVS